MKKRSLDCLITSDGPIGTQYSAIGRYIACSFGINEPKIVFPLEGNPVLFGWLETTEGLAPRVLWPGVDLKIGGPGIPTWSVANYIKELGYEKGAIGVVGLSDYVFLEGWISYTCYSLLQKFLPKVTWVDATTMMTDIKAIKSEEEIRLIEKASEIADKAIETMVMHAKPGVLEQELWARIMYTILSEGGDSGFDGSMHIMTIGTWQFQAYPFLKHHMIKAGDVILTEFYPKYGGYTSHPHQPVFVGKVPDEYEKCHPVLLESIHQGIAAMTSEHTWNEVAEAFAKPVREAGMWGIQVAVHGLGLTMPDPPFLPMPGCERKKSIQSIQVLLSSPFQSSNLS
jgi:Xaa-Pro aminopeptidase